MPIRIVPCGNEFTKLIEGVAFTLRRPSEEEDLALKREHTSRGLLDQAGYSRGLLRVTVRDWGEGITTADGQPYHYAVDHVWSLPDSIRAQIIEAVIEGRPTHEPGSSSSDGSIGG